MKPRGPDEPDPIGAVAEGAAVGESAPDGVKAESGRDDVVPDDAVPDDEAADEATAVGAVAVGTVLDGAL